MPHEIEGKQRVADAPREASATAPMLGGDVRAQALDKAMRRRMLERKAKAEARESAGAQLPIVSQSSTAELAEEFRPGEVPMLRHLIEIIRSSAAWS